MGALLSLVSGTLAFIELSASGLPSIPTGWGRTRHGVSPRNYDMANRNTPILSGPARHTHWHQAYVVFSTGCEDCLTPGTGWVGNSAFFRLWLGGMDGHFLEFRRLLACNNGVERCAQNGSLVFRSISILGAPLQQHLQPNNPHFCVHFGFVSI